jgi:hypothetical protein
LIWNDNKQLEKYLLQCNFNNIIILENNMTLKLLSTALAFSVITYIAPAFAKTLTAEEISSEIIGVNLNWKNRRGTIGTIKYNADGSFVWRAGSVRNGAGNWRVEGDKFCSKFNKTSTWKGRPWRCSVVKIRNSKFRIGKSSVWK